MDRTIDIEDFREWVINASDEQLSEFVEDASHIILSLEEDDFFGTEGLNKRFA